MHLSEREKERKKEGQIIVRVAFEGSFVIIYGKWTLFYAQLKFNCSLTLLIFLKLNHSFPNEESCSGVYENLPSQSPI